VITLKPSIIYPKTTFLPLNQGAGSKVIKNYELEVLASVGL
jgi:hypothetical protein